ncbi:hypothetical protein PMNALOAF_1655 [Methylobacterium adhaesivum]|jgi:hypothetical protein|uniref:hypothetical protein n=1 Tax=Methylobacterium adhaesivum TaxID=333297 RepID=UPI002080FC83|nr:hypothetical protein PMNALOAF_1655 [Methylobacterium adhaesivum]
MSYHHAETAARALNQRSLAPPLVDLQAVRARNELHVDRPTRRGAEPAPTRIIEIGEVTAGIAVPEKGGVRFFSSQSDFDLLDGTVFGSVEQAARAARERFRARSGGRGRPAEGRRLIAV